MVLELSWNSLEKMYFIDIKILPRLAFPRCKTARVVAYHAYAACSGHSAADERIVCRRQDGKVWESHSLSPAVTAYSVPR